MGCGCGRRKAKLKGAATQLRVKNYRKAKDTLMGKVLRCPFCDTHLEARGKGYVCPNCTQSPVQARA